VTKKKPPNPNPQKAELDGLVFILRNGRYEVELPHPFRPGRHWHTQKFETRASDLQEARRIAGVRCQADVELAALVDDEEASRRLEVRDKVIGALLRHSYGSLPAVESIRSKVVEKWLRTIESFSIDPFTAVQTVPIVFPPDVPGSWKPPRPLAYWMSRKGAQSMQAQETYLHTQRRTTYSSDVLDFSSVLATCDEETGWGYGAKLKGVSETVHLLARARKSRELLARVFLRASLHNTIVRFRLSEDPNAPQRRLDNRRYPETPYHVESDDGELVLALAGLCGEDPWHHASKQTLPDVMVSHGENYLTSFRSNDHRLDNSRQREITVRSLSELVELLAVEHARVIAQHVVVLFVDEQNPDPDLELSPYGHEERRPVLPPREPPSRDERLLEIKADLFDELKKSPALQAQARKRMKDRPKPQPPKADPTPPAEPPSGSPQEDHELRAVDATAQAVTASVEPPAELKATPASVQAPRQPRRHASVEKVQPMAKTYSYLEKLKARKRKRTNPQETT